MGFWPDVTRSRALVLLLALITIIGCSRDTKTAAADALARGNAYFDSSRYREAAIEYRQAVQLDPARGDARRKLAEAHLKTGNMEGALREMARAADLLPDDADLQVSVGNLLLAAGRFEDAKARADRAVSLRPEDIDAHVLRGNALVGLKDLDGALAEMESTIISDPDSAVSYVSLGAMQYLRGDRDKAEAAFTQALRLDPLALPARLSYARFLMLTNRSDDAESQLKQAFENDETNALVNWLLAVFYINSQRYGDAEPHLVRLAEDPDDSAARFSLAQLYIATDRIDQGTVLLRGLAAREATFETATLLLAHVAHGRNDRAAAHSLVRDVLDRSPGNPRALTARAGFLLAEHKATEAAEAATAAVAAQPSLVHASFLLAEARRALRQVEEAKKAYGDVLRLQPGHVRAQVALSELHLVTGQLDEARQLAERAKRQAPNALQTRAALARSALALGDFSRAHTEVRALLQDYPQSPEVHILDGSVRMREKDIPGAERAFLAAAQLSPSSFAAAAGLVAVDIAAGRPDAARRRADRIVLDNAATVDGLMLAARTYHGVNDAGRAETTLRRAMQVDPARSEPYGMLGQLYVQQRRMDQALREFQALAKRQPSSVAVSTMIAAILEHQNRKSEAKEAYRNTLAIDPTAPVAANNLAWLLVESNESLDEALRLAQAAKARLPESGDVADTLGWIYLKKGLVNLAIPELKAAVARAPDNAGYKYHLGFAYAQSGYLELAEQMLDTALRLDPKAADAPEARKTLARLATK
jgi:tetratricopeptide (TPR) repeat protein